MTKEIKQKDQALQEQKTKITELEQ